MTLLVATLMAAMSLVTLPCATRLDRLRGGSADSDQHESRAHTGVALVENAVTRLVLCTAGGAAAGGVFGPSELIVGALVGAVVAWQAGRLESSSERRRRAAIERDLPLAVDLLAACALAGRPVEDSLAAVARAVGGPLSDDLIGHVYRLRLGVDPVSEWRRLRDHDQLGPLARTMLRSFESGAPIAASLQLLAVDVRREHAIRLQKRARSVGVRAAAPLALCFLPAFMLIGIVPTVVGGFQHLVLR